MEFSKIKEEVMSVSYKEIRCEKDDYFEAVLVKEKVPSLLAKLDALFSSCAYPSPKGIPSQAEAVIGKFGGIMKGQTLYFSDNNGSPVFAMLWPWQDKENITLKLGRKG